MQFYRVKLIICFLIIDKTNSGFILLQFSKLVLQNVFLEIILHFHILTFFLCDSEHLFNIFLKVTSSLKVSKKYKLRKPPSDKNVKSLSQN